MIGKPEWFSRRKYTGWGFNPKTWQGWVYVLVMVSPIIIIANLQTFGTVQMIFLIAWAVIFGIDIIDITIHLGRDERERIHEAIAERNTLWAIIAVLAGGIAYQVSSGVVSHTMAKVDPVILIALAVGLVVKIISNIYLDRKD
jgi:hypothetical protein